MQQDKSSRRPTVKDVATEAGVSASTVSNVLHDHPYVTGETRERVEAAIARLGYRPSLAGRQLRGGRAGVIALAVPDIRNPYFAGLAHVVMTEARRRGLTLFIDETGGSVDQEHQIARGYPTRDVDGVIFCPVAISIDDLESAGSDVATVVLGEHLRTGSFDQVAIDSRASAIEATEHLLDLGRRRLGFLGNCLPSGLGPANLRLEGVRAALDARGLALDDAATFTDTPHGRADGRRATEQLLQRDLEIDGLICAADLQAIGALAAFRAAGVGVPEQVAVLGWDDSPEGQFAAPALTSVAHDLTAIAERSIELILRRQQDAESDSRGFVVHHELKIRASTAPPPDAHSR